MGFFDKMKGALNAVTGGGANVSFAGLPAIIYPGQEVQLRISATSTGGEIKSAGVFVDLSSTEQIDARSPEGGAVQLREAVFHREVQVAPAFVLAPNETKQWDVKLTVPHEARPTYDGKHCKHVWQIRGRIEAFGNDPDTGYLPVRVGLHA